MSDNLKQMQQLIEQAEIAAEDKHSVELRVSRQEYRDLVDANRFLRQASPVQKSIGKRLDKLALRIREALDQSGA